MVLGLATSASAATEADAKLDAFFRRYLDEYFQQQPSDATALGDHRFDAKLEDLSAASRAKWIERTRRALADLPREVDYARLSRAGQVDFEIFKHELEKSLWLNENTRPFEEDPRTYTDYINGSVYVLLTQSTLPKETNLTNAIARMRQIPRLVAAARQTLTHPPRSVLETAIVQNRGSIDFYEKEIFELAGETPQKDALKKAADEVVACLKDYQEFLEKEVRPRANGQWRLGKEKFAKKLELELDAGLTADQVLAAAEADFIRVAARTLSHRKATLGPLLSARSRCRRTTRPGIARRSGPVDQGRREGTWPAGGPHPRRPGDGRADPPLHSRSQDPAPARSGSLPGDRNAGVQAGQFDGLHGRGPAAGRRRRRVSMPSARRPRTGTRRGSGACWRNTTATCSRC